MNKEVQSDKTNDTENKILRAAEREFAAKGFAGARTTAIAEAAGVTHAMLHYYFRTKEKLFDRIVTEKMTILKDVLSQPVADADSSLSDVLRNIIERHLDFIAANPELPRFLIGELLSNSDRSNLYIGRVQAIAPMVITQLQQKIDDAATRGECRKVDARMLMLDIASLNIFSYLATPIVNAALSDCMADHKAFLALRKKENYDTIMRKLKP